MKLLQNVVYLLHSGKLKILASMHEFAKILLTIFLNAESIVGAVHQ